MLRSSLLKDQKSEQNKPKKKKEKVKEKKQQTARLENLEPKVIN